MQESHEVGNNSTTTVSEQDDNENKDSIVRNIEHLKSQISSLRLQDARAQQQLTTL